MFANQTVERALWSDYSAIILSSGTLGGQSFLGNELRRTTRAALSMAAAQGR
jgi:hypothetical protein